MSRESGAGPERNGNHNGGANKGGANSGSSSTGGGGGKGGGKNDSGGSNSSSKIGNNKGKNDTASPSSSRGSIGPIGGASMYGGESVRNAMTKDNSNKNGGSKVSDRLASVSKTLGTYKQSPALAPVSNAHQISSVGGASMYGMAEDQKGLLGRLAENVGLTANTPDTGFNQTINTDNVSGVIRNWEGKEKNGTLTDTDKQHIAQMAGGFNKQTGLNLAGYGVLGSLGGAAAKKVGELTSPGDYFSDTGRRIASGQFDSSRLEGSEDDVLGHGGGLDGALKSALGLVSSFVPGLGYLTNVAGAGLTQPAAGTGAVLNGLAGNKTGGPTSGDGGSRDYAPPPRQSLTGANQGEGAQAFDSNYYDPSRFNVTAGKRGY